VQRRRQEVLGTCAEGVRQLERVARVVADEGLVVVVGSEAAFAANHAEAAGRGGSGKAGSRPMFRLVYPLGKE
jgi:hypothetical protein